MHMRDLLPSAEFVVLAEVMEVRAIPHQSVGRHAPNWAMAVLRVETALKGQAQEVRLLFPTSQTVEWFNAPRFEPKQRGIFIIHRREPLAPRWIDESAMGTALTALEPADFQPESRLDDVKELLTANGAHGYTIRPETHSDGTVYVAYEGWRSGSFALAHYRMRGTPRTAPGAIHHRSPATRALRELIHDGSVRYTP
jgi:hypothetical protein